MPAMLRLGIVSDTHGLLRPRVLELLAGVDQILHAGDVGNTEILTRLATVAPVTAVRGNTDMSGDVVNLPAVAAGEIGDASYRMTHRRDDIREDWLGKARLVVFGHSHRPELSWHGDCLLLNPGAVGQRRFKLPLTLAIVEIEGDKLVPQILSAEDIS